jgi:hypothetical protein
MTKFNTSLAVSKRLHEMGVKAESEKYWDSHAIVRPSGYGLTSDGEYPAYNLAEMAEVLREVNNIKEKGSFVDSIGWRGCTVAWKEFCLIFFDEGEQEANAYLESII